METEKSESLMEFFSKGLALLGPICIGFSVFYDWGYLYGLGLSFREIPTTIADHIRSAIIWLPYGAVYSVFIISIGMYFGKKDASLNADPALWKKKERLESFIWIANGILLILAWVLWGDRLFSLGAFGVGQLLLAMVFSAMPNATKKLRLIYLLSGVSCLCASALFAVGGIGAASLLSSEPKDEFLLKKLEANEVMRGAILRRFEQSVIIMSDKHAIIILKPEELLRVTIGVEQRRYKGVMCNYFKVSCLISALPNSATLAK